MKLYLSLNLLFFKLWKVLQHTKCYKTHLVGGRASTKNETFGKTATIKRSKVNKCCRSNHCCHYWNTGANSKSQDTKVEETYMAIDCHDALKRNRITVVGEKWQDKRDIYRKTRARKWGKTRHDRKLKFGVF